MKKFAWMLAMVLPMGFAFTSCGDDDNDGLTMDQTEVSVDYGKDTKLKASEGGCTWSSSNDFVATVDKDGKVVAQHVGEAIITATKNGEAATCKVVVKATDNTYVMPVIAFGKTMAEVEAAMGSDFVKNPQFCDDETLFFGTTTDMGFPWYTYSFDNNALDASSLTVELTDDLAAFDTMKNYLTQRYQFISKDDVKLSTIYADAASLATAKTVVTVMPGENMDTYMAIFTPNDESKAGAVEARVAKMAKKINSIRK